MSSSVLFFAWIAILEHHVSCSPAGTRSKIPFITSASMSAFTWALKCVGTSVGFLQQHGIVSGLVWVFIGLPVATVVS